MQNDDQSGAKSGDHTQSWIYDWCMTRRGADEISADPALQARWRRLQRQERPAVPAEMSAATRDALIMRLHKQGYSPAEIGGACLTRRGAAAAIDRIREGRPGRVRAE